MESLLYDAVMKALQGHHSTLDSYHDQFDILLTPNRNTVLHVAAEFGRSCCAEKILEESPLLFRRSNIYGETPLHHALAGGHFDVAKLLIDHANSEVVKHQSETNGRGGEPEAALREMLRARNHNGDTVLHLAARCMNKKLLEEILRSKDPELDYGPNEAGETLMYLVVEQRFKAEVVSQITEVVPQITGNCESCELMTYGGPSNSTAMHMAAMNDDVAVMDILHKWKDHLIKKPDAHGWTPLHYAARCHKTNAIGKLLLLDKSLGYVTASNACEGNTALHIATALGDTRVMGKILLWCPDCWEVVNSKKQNILHIAVDLERDEAVGFIVQKPWVTHVIGGKDENGDTPLHVLASKGQLDRFLRQWPSFGGDRLRVLNNKYLTPFEVRDQNDSRADHEETKHEEKGKTWQREIRYYNRRDIASKDREAIHNWKEAKVQKDKARRKEGEQRRKIAKTHMIVATLIATISFTASFTVPGGYDPNPGSEQGMAILRRELAFKVFVLTNSMTVIFSTSSVFLFVSASFFNHKDDEDKQTKRYEIALVFNVIAMVTMMVAFISGTFAMLEHSLFLAIGAIGVSCFAYAVYALEIYKIVRERIKRALEDDRELYFSNEESIEKGLPLENDRQQYFSMIRSLPRKLSAFSHFCYTTLKSKVASLNVRLSNVPYCWSCCMTFIGRRR